MKLTSKITAKDILGGSVAQLVKEILEIGETKLFYAVAGKASSVKSGVSTFGEWNRFDGSITAINYITGECFRGKSVHVPEVLEDILIGGLTQHDEIEFAYEVSIERLGNKEDGGVSYKYHVDPKSEIKESDDLVHLTNLLTPPDNAKSNVTKIAKKKA